MGTIRRKHKEKKEQKMRGEKSNQKIWLRSRAAQNIRNSLCPPALPTTCRYTSESHIKRAKQFVIALPGEWLWIDVLSGNLKPPPPAR